MTGRTNYTAPNNGLAPLGPDQMTDIYEHFDPLVGETAPNAASLPTADLFVGRLVWVQDVKALYVNMTGLSSGWVRIPAVPHAEFQFDRTAIADGTVNLFNTSLITGRTTDNTFATISGSTGNQITLVSAGLYLLSWTVSLGAAATARSLATISTTAEPLAGRGSTFAGEDTFTVTTQLLTTAANTLVNFVINKTVGGAFNITSVIKVTKVG